MKTSHVIIALAVVAALYYLFVVRGGGAPNGMKQKGPTGVTGA